MDAPRREFLHGERTDDVVIYVAGDVDLDALGGHGESVDDGVVLVLPGDQGRSAFESATGIDPMEFAGSAMDTDGDIDPELTGGDCPSAHPDEPEADHAVEFLFAFAEEQNEEVGGLYEHGDVVHAYAACSCGTSYSDRWVVEE
ncbi:DUF5807 family protein [Halomarina salina]|uniref:DUF5807 family protein n=1 Tax=Halomarina salina TaxID=1872699 RepID=A0ABD5RL76_9EURY|nr:DUF5807 family protein [Halomarina salina]